MIRMRQGSIWLILVCVLAFYSSAEAKGFYFGASLGQGEAKDLDLSPIGDGSTLTGGTDGTDSGWKFFGGVKVFRFMNAEFSYRDYGQSTVPTCNRRRAIFTCARKKASPCRARAR